MSQYTEIITKFEATCNETGRRIPRGAAALLSKKTANLYSWESKMYEKHREREWDSVDLAKGIAKFFES